MSLLPVITPRELAQTLQGILKEVPEEMDPGTVLGPKEKRSIRDWVATAEAACTAASTPELVQVEQMALALRYRTKLISEKSAPEPLEPLIELVRAKYPTLFSDHLLEFSRNQVDYLSRHYPQFAKRLFDQLQKAPDEWAANFIKFCLQAPSQSYYKQATIWIDIFIKYPEIAHLLMKCGIYEKLGLYPENIQINTIQGVRLKIEMRFQSKKKLEKIAHWIPIKETSTILAHLLKNNPAVQTPLSEDWDITMEAIFKAFETSASPDFAVSTNGIINLNPLLLGSRKNKDGTTTLIDPQAWTEHKPCIEITELEKLYGIQNDTPYGFVLRADRQFSHLPQAKSHAFFDFVMRLPNGNYRVITMNPDQGHGIYLRQQKMVFYPLSEEQGKDVIKMVAQDIEKYRAAHGQGKSVSYVDIEPYIDEVFGRDFYASLERVIDKIEVEKENTLDCKKIKKQLTLAKQTLDPEDFEKFLSPLIDKLVKTRDIPTIRLLIEKSLTTLKLLLQKEANKIPLPTQQDVESAAHAIYNEDSEGRVLRESLLALTRLCFVALHPFSIKVTDAERNTPIIGKLFQIAQSITWKWLRDLLSDFLLLILGPFRGYRYQKLEGAPENRIYKLVETIRNWQPARYLNRPSQLFSNYDEATLNRTVEDITKHLNVLASRNS